MHTHNAPAATRASLSASAGVVARAPTGALPRFLLAGASAVHVCVSVRAHMHTHTKHTQHTTPGGGARYAGLGDVSLRSATLASAGSAMARTGVSVFAFGFSRVLLLIGATLVTIVADVVRAVYDSRDCLSVLALTFLDDVAGAVVVTAALVLLLADREDGGGDDVPLRGER
jgi:hypothetical protein